MIYAFLAALLVEGLNIGVPDAVMEGLEVFPPTYTLLGMMIIGMTLGRVTLRQFDWRFIGACVAVRYLLWPLLALGSCSACRPRSGYRQNLPWRCCWSVWSPWPPM